MKIVLLVNNWTGWQVAEWLSNRRESIVGVVMHSAAQRKYGDEIIRATGVQKSAVIDGSRLRDEGVLLKLRSLGADMAVSIFFGHIVRREFIAIFPRGVLNLHPALLPYNRGAYPNVWSIIDGTPAGVTLHYIDEQVDTGDIVAQQQVVVEPVDTGGTLYRKLEKACVDLFQEAWPKVVAGTAGRQPQSPLEGTTHRVKDVERVDELNLDRTFTGRELVNILRARTCPPYPGAYFRVNGRKVFISVDLRYEDSVGQERVS